MARVGQQTAVGNLPTQSHVGDLGYQVVLVMQQHVGRLEVHVHNLPCRAQTSGQPLKPSFSQSNAYSFVAIWPPTLQQQNSSPVLMEACTEMGCAVFGSKCWSKVTVDWYLPGLKITALGTHM